MIAKQLSTISCMILHFILIKIAFFSFVFSNLDFNGQKQGAECLGKFEKSHAHSTAAR